MDDIDEESSRRVLARFKSETGEETGGLFDVPINVSVEQLTTIINQLLQQDEHTPYTFLVDDKEISKNLDDAVDIEKVNSENVVEIVYQQQAVFKVRPVTRCTSSLPGHAEAVISVKFSPDGTKLASGSGDTTVRFWDLNTQTPHHCCQGHKNWVLSVAWSPDSSRLVSGCKNGVILQWDSVSGKQLGPAMTGHKQWITALVWQPFHLDEECREFASAGKDGTIRLWDSKIGRIVRVLSGHTKGVSCLVWGGTGLLYSSSQDRTIKVWRAADGTLCRTLEGHAHWVNTLVLNCDYVLRTGAGAFPFNQKKSALVRYQEVVGSDGEMLVSGSDDFTMFLWRPESCKKPIARLTGHQQLINHVTFSPDGRLLASASFDKSVKLWDGKTGSFLGSLRGHVQPVYMLAWAPDSRLVVSCSADSTLKVWNIKTKKLLMELPGHADQVFAVDWSPTGMVVASGGKDKLLKLWQH